MSAEAESLAKPSSSAVKTPIQQLFQPMHCALQIADFSISGAFFRDSKICFLKRNAINQRMFIFEENN